MRVSLLSLYGTWGEGGVEESAAMTLPAHSNNQVIMKQVQQQQQQQQRRRRQQQQQQQRVSPRACKLLLIATAWSSPSPSTRLFFTRSLPAKSTMHSWLVRAPWPSALVCRRLSMKAAWERELCSFM
jgi:hypothetical protein